MDFFVFCWIKLKYFYIVFYFTILLKRIREKYSLDLGAFYCLSVVTTKLLGSRVFQK